MSTMLNLSKLMDTESGYLCALRVGHKDRELLSMAREEIRDTLRHAFQNWSSFVKAAELRDWRVDTSPSQLRLPTPKFRIQGSFAYHTLNDCQFPPTQQIDQDDGVFLPLSFVTSKGRARPAIASNAYFALVERALKPLCDKKGWILNPRKEKGSCVRIQLSDRLHIDLPLYAVRDAAFEEMVEFAAVNSVQKAQIRDAVELDERVYRNLAEAEIVLAHRTQQWVESDPRRLERWFENAVELYGSVVRELSRAVKGLRDAKFNDGLSSICIMASVVRAIESSGQLDPQRFDLALAKIMDEMARRIDEPVTNPAFPTDLTKNLCAGWDPEYREQVKELLLEASARLDRAMNGTYNKAIAISHVRNAFGDRVPDREDLIVLGGASANVREQEPDRQPKPLVPRTRSG